MVRDDMDIETASMSFVNPLTALGLLDKIKKLKQELQSKPELLHNLVECSSNYAREIKFH